jgi:hypothetical protein
MVGMLAGIGLVIAGHRVLGRVPPRWQNPSRGAVSVAAIASAKDAIGSSRVGPAFAPVAPPATVGHDALSARPVRRPHDAAANHGHDERGETESLAPNPDVAASPIEPSRLGSAPTERGRRRVNANAPDSEPFRPDFVP